ncbi:hypothetical protein O7606_23315 [Micromonospora sp. WMMD882]|uniref:hypothetical protein n=1 Tax=Micromonospora sp. WMMD882 TaxID=3015151 RepID=UPI00248C4E61|nr:hypothetical protein [Micromonospora sp. WMMD882]WBB79082.1 hypothetical protein O7606_23315 [Micromonospora sp. WMMD882]
MSGDRLPRMGWVALVAVASLVVTGGLCRSASAEVTPLDHCTSVDGGELVYDDFTRYDASLSHAVNQWNALSPITVRPDDAFTYADVDVSDYTSTSDSRAGWFDCSSGADELKLNTHWMDDYNTSQRHAVVTHELGHALKLGHGPEAAVMDPCPACYNPNMSNNLQPWDVTSYHAVWGY